MHDPNRHIHIINNKTKHRISLCIYIRLLSWAAVQHNQPRQDPSWSTSRRCVAIWSDASIVYILAVVREPGVAAEAAQIDL